MQNNINFSEQEKFNFLPIKCINPKTNYPLRFDFYLPDYNLCIEYQGAQHYIPFSFNTTKDQTIFEKNFEYQQYKDDIKICKRPI